MKFIYTFLFLNLAFLSVAQDGWHRLYESDLSDTLLVTQDGAAIDNDTYVMMNYGVSTEGVAERLFITKLDKKGNIEGSYRISPPQDLLIEEFSGGNIVFNSISKTLVFSFVGKTAEEYRVYMGSMSQGGNNLIVSQVDSEFFDLTIASSLFNDESVANNTIIVENNNASVNIIKAAEDQSFQWASGYVSENHNLTASSSDINSAAETVVAGSYGINAEVGTFYVKVDQQGDVLSSKKYLDISNGLSNVNILTKSDGGLYMSTQSGDEGILLSLDTIGDVLWSKVIDINGLPTFTSSLSANNNGGVIIGGSYEENTQLRHFTINIGADGYPVNASQYQNNTLLTDLQNTSVDYNQVTGGYFFFGNSMNNMDTVITLMSHTSMDSITCSTLLEIDTFQNFAVAVDTLIIEKEAALSTLNTVNFISERVTLFSVPELSIDADQRLFCPDEEVNELLTAAVSIAPASAITYLWNTEATTDTIRGTETDVPYVVETTIAYQECFKMCDTIQLQRYPLPVASISQVAVSNCEWVLNGNADNLGALKNGNVNYSWNTGSTEQNITVPEGTYTLTITDDCGEQAEATITLSNSVVSTEIIVLDNNNCEDITLGLDITNPSNDMSITWSTGETTSTINVNEPSNYSVTVIDQQCNLTATDSYTYDRNDPVTGYEINTDGIICDPDNAENISGKISVTTDGGNAIVVFTSPSGGKISTNELEIIQHGTIQISVSDLCGNVFLDSVNTRNICITSCIKYPIVFFPNGDSETTSELTFGPVAVCDDTMIEEDGYEFKIYNRWGQEVFSTTDPSETWDGTYGGEDAPSEVYVYYALYKTVGNEEEQLSKGDVTIIR